MIIDADSKKSDLKSPPSNSPFDQRRMNAGRDRRIPACTISKQLKDTDPIPFGKYSKTIPPTLMQDVPADYFFYLWINGKEHNKQCPVADYIRRNLTALKQEHPDGIWEGNR